MKCYFTFYRRRRKETKRRYSNYSHGWDCWWWSNSFNGNRTSWTSTKRYCYPSTFPEFNSLLYIDTWCRYQGKHYVMSSPSSFYYIIFFLFRYSNLWSQIFSCLLGRGGCHYKVISFKWTRTYKSSWRNHQNYLHYIHKHRQRRNSFSRKTIKRNRSRQIVHRKR